MTTWNEDLRKQALLADIEWSAILKAEFGRNAGDVRYTVEGQGRPGTPLRAAYEKFQATSAAWRLTIRY